MKAVKLSISVDGDLMVQQILQQNEPVLNVYHQDGELVLVGLRLDRAVKPGSIITLKIEE